MTVRHPSWSPYRARSGHVVRPDRAVLALRLVIIHLDLVCRRRTIGAALSVEASEMVSVPRADLDALKAELRRLRREVGRGVARVRIRSDSGPGDDAVIFTREQLAEAWGISE